MPATPVGWRCPILVGAKAMLCAMLAGSALCLWLGARDPEPERATHVQVRPERPWLTHEAAAQIVGPDGTLGPLFAGVELGGPAPSPGVAARIAEFARANDVRLDLEVVDGALAAVRFDVSYSGCCGYEGADTLAMRLGRQSTGGCCVCGPDTWINDWAAAGEGGIQWRVHVRVNRVTVRWERTPTLPELVERADGMLGLETSAVRRAAGDRWNELEPDRYSVDVALPLPGRGSVQLRSHGDLGVELLAQRGRIVQVSLALRGIDDEAAKALPTLLRARWGSPRVKDQHTWMWWTSDRVITAERDATQLTIAKR